MNRREKIKTLQDISKGRQSIHSLNPASVYMFTETTEKPGFYYMDGKEFTETEYQSFCETVRKKNKNTLIWNEHKTYQRDIILTLRPAKDIIQ